MDIILFTQEDPFYLSESTYDLICKIKGSKHKIVKAIVSKASPYGKNESFIKKTYKTFKIFGIKFFVFYLIKYLKRYIFSKTVSEVLIENNIDVLKINNSINSSENERIIKSLDADIILIIAGNQIIKKNILQSTKYGVFNVHSSLLPEYKGLMPSFWVMKNNEKITGVTLYKLTEGIDNGPIISQKKIKINPEFSQSDLVMLLKIEANNLIVETLHLIKDSKNLRTVEGGTYFKFPTKIDVKEFKHANKKFF
tara:strand:- start:1925 stop:2683 length:759 start_codon:yes stop_codon:yes gene_type:complete